jgi:hypothetical protein
VDALDRGGHLRIAQGEHAGAVGGLELGQGDAQRLGQQRVGQAADDLLGAEAAEAVSALSSVRVAASQGTGWPLTPRMSTLAGRTRRTGWAAPPSSANPPQSSPVPGPWPP